MEWLALAILIAFFVAVSSMMLKSWDTVVVDARKEEKRLYEARVEAEAERRFQEAIRNAKYRVHYKPIVLINESDIEWN